MPQVDELLALARSRAGSDRERLIGALADLLDATEAAPTAEAAALLSEIFLGVVRHAEREIRKRVAERISAAAWTPFELIQLLIFDEIDIARPVIARSPLLQDADLIRLLVHATLDHQIEVARRPQLTAAVVGAILDQAEPDVITALAGNATADVSPLAMARLVTLSRRVASARAPLTRHPRLTEALAHSLYSWVGEALKANLAGRFDIDPALLSATVDGAVRDVPGIGGTDGAGLPPGPDRDEIERKLVRKLEAAGELRPGFLLKALREGRLSLFAHVLAALGRCDIEEVWLAVDAPDSEPLARACAAVGVDRSAFPTLLTLVRSLNAGRPASDAPPASRPPLPGVAVPAFQRPAGRPRSALN